MIDVNSKFYCEQEYFVRYSEMDYNKVLKPSAFLNFLQDLATIAADKVKFGFDEVFSQNLGWFLLKYHIEFNEYPQNILDLVIKTEARGYNKLFANRDFEVYTRDNKLVARVISHWALVNLETKTMVPPASIFGDIMPKMEKREDDMSFEKVHSPERIDYLEEFKVRFDDIDVNHHVNNMNYIIWAFEALPKEFKEAHKLKKMDMVFKKEVQYGNSVVSEIQLDGLTAAFAVKNKADGEELCLIKADFVNI